MSLPEKRAGFLFRLTAGAGAVFVITIFALVAAMLGDPEAPPAKFLNRHGTAIIIGEVGLILVIGLLAMTVDRFRILRDARNQSENGWRGQEPKADGPDERFEHRSVRGLRKASDPATHAAHVNSERSDAPRPVETTPSSSESPTP